MSCFVAGTFAKVPVMGNKIRLTDNWDFLRQDVGNIWELVRPVKKGRKNNLYGQKLRCPTALMRRMLSIRI